MPAAVPIAMAVITAVGVGVEMNQSKQAEKGAKTAAREQQDQMDRQISDQKKKDQSNLNMKQTSAGASQKAAIDAIRASMTTNGAMGGTILTGPQGASPAPTQSKTLLGV